MKTPVCDFAEAYANSDPMRLHMPGHKGKGFLGAERLDITEIDGADVLYSAQGIIAESQLNASALFQSGRTLYSAEGSSLCIRAMLYLALLYGRKTGRKPVIAAARNAHKTFMTGAAALDLDVKWLYPAEQSSLLSCKVTPRRLEQALDEMAEPPAAVYVTSPDYLGNMADTAGLAQVCHDRGILLLVDNAHGAYLNFLPQSLHPMALGADMCCDSAHKTLPVLTGGAYLHIGKKAPAMLSEAAKDAMSFFASTSPSYLILQSLDKANAYLNDGYRERLADFAQEVSALKVRLAQSGFVLSGDEPMKLTVCPKSYGYTGKELADYLAERGIISEFADPDFTVLMLTPQIEREQLYRLEKALTSLKRRAEITEKPPVLGIARRVMSVREAALSLSETVNVSESEGRVLAAANVSCPPAIPIAACGEEISPSAVACFKYYGIEKCRVVAAD